MDSRFREGVSHCRRHSQLLVTFRFVVDIYREMSPRMGLDLLVSVFHSKCARSSSNI